MNYTETLWNLAFSRNWQNLWAYGHLFWNLGLEGTKKLVYRNRGLQDSVRTFLNHLILKMGGRHRFSHLLMKSATIFCIMYFSPRAKTTNTKHPFYHIPSPLGKDSIRGWVLSIVASVLDVSLLTDPRRCRLRHGLSLWRAESENNEGAPAWRQTL